MIRSEAIIGVAFGTATDGDGRSSEDARRRVSEELAIDDAWATITQVHGSDVIVARSPGMLGEADAVVALRGGPPVAIATADCVPVALAGASSIALVHAGWRGVASGVVAHAVQTMRSLGDPPDRAVIGPHIGPCCYEVGDDVVEAVGGHDATTTWGTTSVDLGAAITDQLAGIGIESVAACTMHDDRFASFRRNGTAQRQVTVAWVP
jgi:YfiH family protein